MDSIESLATSRWGGKKGSRLAGPWSNLLAVAGGDPIALEQEAVDLESGFSTEANILEDYAGRYPIELLQNAQDAAAEAKLKGASVWMHVSDDALLVGNQGRPFDEDRIRGLLNLAVGTKKAADAEHHTIGYKGIGFTSVFEITDRPQVFSEYYEFCLDGVRAKPLVEAALGLELPGVSRRRFAFPIGLAEVGNDRKQIKAMRKDGAVTVIRMPFRDRGMAIEPEEVRAYIQETLRPEVLLFMPSVNRISISGQGPAVEYRVVRGRKLHGGRVATIECTGRPKQDWLLFERREELDPKVTASLRQEVWKSAKDVGAAVAIPWNRGRPDPERNPHPVHVFFPTLETTGRRVLIHGDFYVQSDRTRIHSANDSEGSVTRQVAHLAADLIADAAAELGRFGSDLLRCLAPLEDADGFGHELNDIIDQRLGETEWLRSAAGGELHDPSTLECLGADVSPADGKLICSVLVTSSDLLDPLDGTDPDIVGWLGQLGMEQAAASKVFRRVDATAYRGSYDALLAAFGRYRSSHLIPSWNLASCAVVQSEVGEWVAPNDTVIRVEGVPPLPPRASIAAVRMPRTADAKEFVQSLSIDELDAPKAAQLVVEASEQLDDTDPIGAEMLLRYLHRLWSGHRRMLREVDDPGRAKVPCHSATGSTLEWRRADTAYFSSSWVEGSVVEALYGGLKQREFLADEPISGERPDLAFFEWLGVASEPRASRSEEEYVLPRDLATREWMRECGLAAANPCEGHPETYRKVTTPWLDRIDRLIEGSSSRRRVLAAYLGQQPELLGPSIVACTSSQHSGLKVVGRAEGRVARLVLARDWLPARLPDGRDVNLRPSECWVDLPVGGEHFALPTVDLPMAVAAALGCGSGRHPLLRPILAGLERLRREWPELADAPDAVIETADWLFGRIHPALKGSALEFDGLQVPAWCSRGRVWSRRPLVADVDGIEAFENLEWAPRNVDHRTCEALGLKSASEVVSSTPLPSGQIDRDDVLTATSRCALYALVQKDSTDIGRLAFRLAKLEQFSVAHLDVQHEYSNKIVRSSQPMHLATILNKRGRLNGGKLYLRHDWHQSVPAAAGRLVGYLGEPEMADRVAHFLSAPAAVMEMYEIDEDAMVEAEAALKRYRRLPENVAQPAGGASDAGDGDDDESMGDEDRDPTRTGASRSKATGDRTAGDSGGSSGARSRNRSTSGSSSGSRRSRASGKRSKSRRKQSRLITYVAPGDEEAERQDPQVTASRRASDLQGIDAVLDYELRAGRHPKPMDHGNKGYDIESYATAAMSGAVDRYIEVKSLKHEWGEAGVKLSRAQFDFGRGEHSDRAWLYVVEHAQSNEPRVHALPRVARRADGFYFDHGWRAFAEDPSVSSEQIIEEQVEYFQGDAQPLLAELLRMGAPVPETLEGPSAALPGLAQDSIVEAAWAAERVAIVVGDDAGRDVLLSDNHWQYWPLDSCTVDQLAQALGLDDQSA